MQRLAVLTCVTLTACGPSYYIVQSRLAQSTKATVAEVNSTETYKQVLPEVKKVAVRAPDMCALEGASSVTGTANVVSVMLQTRCGVAIAEIERALIQAGYTVYSWRAVSDLATREKLTPMEAAKRLGAQVLFQINSLERSTGQVGLDVRWEREFHEATATGMRTRRATVSSSRKKEFVAIVRGAEAGLLSNSRLAVTIDVSAILVETGETIWLYGWTNLGEASKQTESSVLIVCGNTCQLAVQPTEKKKPGDPSSGEVLVASFGGGPADAQNAEYFALLRRTVTDLVAKFTGK